MYHNSLFKLFPRFYKTKSEKKYLKSVRFVEKLRKFTKNYSCSWGGSVRTNLDASQVLEVHRIKHFLSVSINEDHIVLNCGSL